MSDGIRRPEAIRIRGQQAIEELSTIKDRCAQYAEDLRIAQDRIAELEAERDRLARELAEARKDTARVNWLALRIESPRTCERKIRELGLDRKIVDAEGFRAALDARMTLDAARTGGNNAE